MDGARGHDLLENVEADMRQALPDTIVITHLEPLEDPRAWKDQPPGGVTIPEDEPGAAADRGKVRPGAAADPGPAARRALATVAAMSSTKSPRDFFRPLAVGARPRSQRSQPARRG